METLALPPGVALRFATPEVEEEDALKALSPEERARRDAFAFSERRLGFTLGRLAARGLLAEHLGCAPQTAPLALTEGGAPIVEGHPLYLSISHAGRGADLLAAAAVAEHPLGLDLEWIRPVRPDLYERILTPEEHPFLEALPFDHDTSQTLLWSLKEAVLKGLQTGFRRTARSIRLTALESGRAEIDAGDGVPWSLHYGRRGAFWITLALHKP